MGFQKNMDFQKYTDPTPTSYDLAKQLRIDYKSLSIELIKELRGKLTQRALSQKLGFSFNQIGKWEKGITQIKWADFLSMAQALEVPIETSIRRSFWNLKSEFSSITTLEAIDINVNSFTAPDQQFQLQRKKWILGVVQPDLPEVLQLIGTRSAVLLGWLSQFVDCCKLVTIKDHFAVFSKILETVMKNPLTVYVNAALMLEEYKTMDQHSDKWLAQHSACSVKALQQVLKLLLNHRLIHFDGRKFHPSTFDFSFAGLRSSKIRSLIHFSTALAANRYPLEPVLFDRSQIKNKCQSSIRVAALSPAASEKISELLTRMHSEIGDIVAKDNLPKENVQVILTHSFCSNFNSPSADDSELIIPEIIKQKII